MFFECKLRKEKHERRGRCRSNDDDCSRREKRERRCEKPGCHSKCGYTMTDGMKVYASYCHEHACLLGPHRCRSMKERDEIYCRVHATCTAAGCFATPDRLSTKQLPWFCDRHQCTFPGCASPGECGGLCALHSALCSVGGCPGFRYPGSPFCELHADRGGMPPPLPPHMAPGWNNPPHSMMPEPNPFFDGPGFAHAAHPGVHQCDMHCTEYRHSNKAAQPESFCRAPGCHRLRQAGGESEWCENHTCEAHACVQRRSDRQPSMRTCERHACAVARCDQPAQSHGSFCRRHGCAADTCARFKESQTGGCFCAEHECNRPRCLERVAAGADYCPRHLDAEQRRAGREYTGGEYRRYEPPCEGSPRVVIVQGDAGGPVCRRGQRRDGSPGCDYGCRCEAGDRMSSRLRRFYYDD